MKDVTLRCHLWIAFYFSKPSPRLNRHWPTSRLRRVRRLGMDIRDAIIICTLIRETCPPTWGRSDRQESFDPLWCCHGDLSAWPTEGLRVTRWAITEVDGLIKALSVNRGVCEGNSLCSQHSWLIARRTDHYLKVELFLFLPPFTGRQP